MNERCCKRGLLTKRGPLLLIIVYDFRFLGSQFGLRLILNIEQYEQTQGVNIEAGVKVRKLIAASLCADIL